MALCDLDGEKQHLAQGPHVNYHGHVRVYARLGHIKRTMFV